MGTPFQLPPNGGRAGIGQVKVTGFEFVFYRAMNKVIWHGVCLSPPVGGHRTRAERVVDAPIGTEGVMIAAFHVFYYGRNFIFPLLYQQTSSW